TLLGAEHFDECHVVIVDSSGNHGLSRQLSRTGTSTVVGSADGVSDTLRGLRHRLGAPTLKDVAVTVHGNGKRLKVDALTGPVDCYPGVRARWVGRVRHQGPVTVTVTGADGDGQKVKVSATSRPCGGVNLPALWAKEQLGALQHRLDTGRVGEEDLQRQLVELSVAHQVACRFTAFVVVDDEGTQVGDGDPVTIVV